ncbi:short-chain dehydrogenase [Alsobacter soli]|uniref:Short-chain dehydrogenase n=1 Tax=Alsobacter soli TaxID=2109933 RepID=A0A2T1HXA9_9HYPH|nr:SDR family oxidoreductase [Alsobacter soli]PSC06327.1 short-chain dehydrogenase [Alsobacter soli]
MDERTGGFPDAAAGTRRPAPVCVITGASAGVGRATALAFARRGWRVGLIARGERGLASAARDVEATGGEALALPLDVADAQAVRDAAEKIARQWGAIDVWINNAMATVFGRVDDVTADEFRRVTEVTYLGQVHGTLAALRHMRQRGSGTIVQVGSALAYRSIPLQSAYCAAKAAVRGFTDSLRCELAHEGSPIRLTMVQLPAVNTPQFDWARNRLGRRLQPVPPIHQPEPVAEEIVRAALTAPRELWIGGSTMEAIAGTMAAPGLLDHYLGRMAWDGQMTPEPADGSPDGNLFAPVDSDPGAHGRFDGRSAGRVAALSPAVARAGLLLGAVGVGLAAWAAGRRGS